MIIYIIWNGISYFLTNYWAYELYKKYIEQKNLQTSIIAASVISIFLLIVTFLLYIVCYLLHSYCACCCSSRNNEAINYDSDFEYSNFSLQMREKVDELEAMAPGRNQEVLKL